MSMVPAGERLWPDHAWHDGQVASWEGKRLGWLYLFEVIDNPQTFKVRGSNSVGDPEQITLFEPQPGQTLEFTLVDPDTNEPLDQPPVVLDADNPKAELPKDAHYIMDATKTSVAGHLAYTCLCVGSTELPA